jgi:TetR/AcrR family transcriptional repressor of nem operon
VNSTASKLIEEASQLIADVGYNGFSYADLSERLGIRKPSIHHHFPSKVDLVVAVIEQQRATIQTHIEALDGDTSDALGQLNAYVEYWKRCIEDQSASFCLAGVLAVEKPGLPVEVAEAVHGHFDDLGRWLKRVMTLGVEQGSMVLELDPDRSSQFFQTTIYGAMVMARAFNDPSKFTFVVDAFLTRMYNTAKAKKKPRSS